MTVQPRTVTRTKRGPPCRAGGDCQRRDDAGHGWRALVHALRVRALSVKIILTSVAALREDQPPHPDTFVRKPFDIDQIVARVARFSRP